MFENTRNPNPTRNTDYTPRKEHRINGMGVQHQYQTLDIIERYSLYQSESGEYYIHHQVREIFKSPMGRELSRRNIDLGVRRVTKAEAEQFQEVGCNPAVFSEKMQKKFREMKNALPRDMRPKNPVSHAPHHNPPRKRKPIANPTIWDPWGFGSMKCLPYPDWD